MSMSMEQARDTALSFPGATEQDHHGMVSFRVRGKIFCTVPDANHLHVMAPGESILEAVALWPDACSEVWWGGRLRCVKVDLRLVDEPLVRDLLENAWRQRAPRALLSCI
jgi:hypothetical protein